MGRDVVSVEDPDAVFLQILVIGVITDHAAVLVAEDQIALVSILKGLPFCTCQ